MSLKNRVQLVLLVIFISIIALILITTDVEQIILEILYPRNYEEYVEKYSKINELDSLLVYSIIKAESNFNTKAVSDSGAIGLMQLMKNTAQEVAEKIDASCEFDEMILKNPEDNIKIGTKYYKELLTRYDDNIVLALIAYNAGIGNTEKWIEEGTINSDGSNYENIPFKETSMYVRKILREYEIYKEIYNG